MLLEPGEDRLTCGIIHLHVLFMVFAVVQISADFPIAGAFQLIIVLAAAPRFPRPLL